MGLRIITLLLVASSLCAGQAGSDAEPSLGDVARSSKKSTHSATAKVVVNDDSPGLSKSPIPEIYSDGLDNTDQIIETIDQYRKLHTWVETEAAIHAWFNHHDDLLRTSIAENRKIEDKQMGGEYRDVYDSYYGDPEHYAQTQLALRRAMYYDQKRKKENGLLAARIQSSFNRVRGHLRVAGLNYEWFKIRCGNGNCSY